MLRSSGFRLVLAAVVLAPIPAAAQPPQSGAAPQSVWQRPQRARVPTRFEPIPQSLEALLNGGAVIVSGTPGMGGLIMRSGNKWMLCGVENGAGSGSAPTSECFALN